MTGLSLMVFLPAVGAAALLLVPRGAVRVLFSVAFGAGLIAFFLSLCVFSRFDPNTAGMQAVERAAWIPAYGVEYIVGVDGLSLFLVLLTALIVPIAILASWTIHDKVKEYLFFMLVLETGMIGTLVALDLFLFYVFWEVMLVPMYFLIGVWGGQRRLYAAVKFVIYTMAGSLLMLVAIIFLATRNYQVTQTLTFNFQQLANLRLPFHEQMWLFLAFALSFAIKVPLFPLHTWLPDAHVEAPTAGSVILAAILLKMGTYGFIRFAIPLFPEAALAAAPYIMALAVVGIVYGAMVAMMQDDIKKLVAYSSVSHLGFVMLGLFAFNLQGAQGAVYQMLNHGLSTGALFLIVGMIYDRRHTRMIADFGGLWKQMPLLSAVFLIVTFSSIGLPGLNGFVGEFLILLGAFQAHPGWAALAATGVVLGAIYMLWMFRRVVYGPLARPENRLMPDMSPREIAMLAPLVALIIFMGVYPQPFLSRIKGSARLALERVEAQSMATPLVRVEGAVEGSNRGR
ncbi:MAG TPA: NADH-quinone oxidoreductase subunit M [Candidatus Binatia bacterium]|nr:NADH-quinone oxidoreductase subunit M [Candidatus Binatia bacterium]